MQQSEEDLLNLWSQLQAPTLDSLKGRYSEFLMAAYSEKKYRWIDGVGYWQGKCFSPIDDQHGGGYSYFEDQSGQAVSIDFTSSTQQSLADGKPTVVIENVGGSADLINDDLKQGHHSGKDKCIDS